MQMTDALVGDACNALATQTATGHTLHGNTQNAAACNGSQQTGYRTTALPFEQTRRVSADSSQETCD